MPDDPHVDIQALKKGIRIGSFLHYQSIKSSPKGDPMYGHSEHLRTRWTCPKCQQSFLVNRSGLMDHLLKCKLMPIAEEPMASSVVPANVTHTTAVTHYCDICNQTFSMSSLDFLRHKRSHKN